MKKKLILVPVLLGSLLLPFNTQAAHFLPTSSVDGKEIRWGTAKGTTGWTSIRNHSINVWNALGVINIAGDTNLTVEDLSFKDVDRPDAGWSGRWTPQSGADLLEYNDFFLWDFIPHQREHTALHEMGHVLRLDHHDLAGNVLRSGVWSYDKLGAHDKEDYHASWGF